jgi:hypothetical protein
VPIEYRGPGSWGNEVIALTRGSICLLTEVDGCAVAFTYTYHCERTELWLRASETRCRIRRVDRSHIPGRRGRGEGGICAVGTSRSLEPVL